MEIDPATLLQAIVALESATITVQTTFRRTGDASAKFSFTLDVQARATIGGPIALLIHLQFGQEIDIRQVVTQHVLGIDGEKAVNNGKNAGDFFLTQLLSARRDRYLSPGGWEILLRVVNMVHLYVVLAADRLDLSFDLSSLIRIGSTSQRQ